MKKTNLFRLFLLLMASVMVLLCFAGCNDNSKKPDDTTESQEEETDPQFEESINNGEYTLQLPPLNYGNAPISVLAWNGWGKTEFSHQVEEMNGVAIDEAILVRDANLSERVGVILDYTPIEVTSNGTLLTKFKTFVQQAYEGGTPFDIVASYSRSNAICASAGYFMNMSNIKDSFLEIDAPWWNEEITTKSAIGDNYYMITGDASALLVQMTYCVYFNADMLLDRGLESPYDLVKDNAWTYEKMLEMGMYFYEDLNDNNKIDLEDMLPIIGEYYAWPAFFHGCGINFATKDDDGMIIVDPVLVDEKAIDLYQVIFDSVHLDGSFVGYDQDLLGNFLAEKSMFWITQSGTAATSFADVEFEYGCVPMPKYDTKQEEYRCTVHNDMTLFSIMRGVDEARHQMITAVLESWAYEAYTETTPVIFEQIMQYQKSASPEMTEMLGLIRDSGYFDFIRLYTVDYGTGIDFIGKYLRNGTNWNEVTKVGGLYEQWCDYNDILMETLMELENS